MSKKVKLNYKQYKHLIDAFTTGDFLIESLEKRTGLVTYKNLLTSDNILYFTQNTKRTCKIPLGVSKKDNMLKTIDLMERSFNYRHSDKRVLENLYKLILCSLLQSYSPSEYEVYYDLEVEGFEDLANLNYIDNPDDLDNTYCSIARSRHNKYIQSGLISYKEYRKEHQEKLVIFLLINIDNIRRLESICAAHLRYGISIFCLECFDISNSSTISLDNTIRPNISIDDIKNEITIYNKMLVEYNKMIKEIDLLTDEIL